jgi:hypothetical protein
MTEDPVLNVFWCSKSCPSSKGIIGVEFALDSPPPPLHVGSSLKNYRSTGCSIATNWFLLVLIYLEGKLLQLCLILLVVLYYIS